MATFTFPARTATPVPSGPDAAQLDRIVSGITDLNASAAENAARATASETQAKGYLKEAEAYGTVGAIAENNATIEGVAGNIRQLQANRAVTRTVGSQRASIAAAGFANSGGALDLMQSSLQEGYLTDQLIQSQTAINQGGFLSQKAASDAEAAGARLASDAQMDLSRSYASAGQLATANAASQTAALQAYLSGSTGPMTEQERLINDQFGFGGRQGAFDANYTSQRKAALQQIYGVKIGPAGWGPQGLDLDAHKTFLDKRYADEGLV